MNYAERIDFEVLTFTPNTVISRAFIDDIGRLAPNWMPEPRDVVRFHYTQDTDRKQMNADWADAAGILTRSLASDELLYVYWQQPSNLDSRRDQRAITGFSADENVLNCSISVPFQWVVDSDIEEVENLIVSCYELGCTRGESIVVVGSELNVDSHRPTLLELIAHAISPVVNPYWLALPQDAVPQDLGRMGAKRNFNGATLLWQRPIMGQFWPELDRRERS